MQLIDYQIEAARTLNEQTPLLFSPNYVLGVIGEVGEVVEMVKKHAFHGHVLDVVAFAKELGDVCWYLAAVATEVGTTLEQGQKQTRLLLTLLQGQSLPTLALRLAAYAAELNVVIGGWRMYRNPEPVATALGSLLRGVQAICLEAGVNFGSVLDGNVRKLKARYPGQFSTLASIRRTE